jgi:hypothetical protein
LLIDTFHNHHRYTFDSNKHNDHWNIYLDYDKMSYTDLILFKKKISIKGLICLQNIRPGIIQSGRLEGVDIHIRPVAHEDAEQTCLTTEYTKITVIVL